MKLKITVHGIAYEVDVEVLDSGGGFPSHKNMQHIMPSPNGKADSNNATRAIQKRVRKPDTAGNGVGNGVTSPIAGTVVEIKCSGGENVTKGQILVVLEAMKMKTSIAAPTDGKIKKVLVAVGDSVRENQMLIELE
jgi:methylmalonyl-CoA carboxyltransferase small subunit